MADFHDFDNNSARLPAAPDTPDDTSREALESDRAGEGYVIREPSMVAAINAALILGKPLLLTGKPGTGKTQLANRIAWFLRLGAPLKFETKSTSLARDLFYSYDALGRFQSLQPEQLANRQARASDSALDFITFNALGQAVLRSTELDKHPATLRSLDNGLPHANVRRALHSNFDAQTYRPRRSLVLIDEMDKASRDFPNDLLNELDRLFFRITEMRSDEEIRASDVAALRPVIVITSNSEKNLPDAFLRRCIYHHIEFPDRATLINILSSRVKNIQGNMLLNSCITLFERFQRQLLQKQPSTAELIDWVRLLAHYGADPNQSLQTQPAKFDRTRSTLAKSDDDQAQLQRTWEEFVKLPPALSLGMSASNI